MKQVTMEEVMGDVNDVVNTVSQRLALAKRWLTEALQTSEAPQLTVEIDDLDSQLTAEINDLSNIAVTESDDAVAVKRFVEFIAVAAEAAAAAVEVAAIAAATQDSVWQQRLIVMRLVLARECTRAQGLRLHELAHLLSRADVLIDRIRLQAYAIK